MSLWTQSLLERFVAGENKPCFAMSAEAQKELAVSVIEVSKENSRLRQENSRLRGALYLIAAGADDAQETAKAALRGQS